MSVKVLQGVFISPFRPQQNTKQNKTQRLL